MRVSRRGAGDQWKEVNWNHHQWPTIILGLCPLHLLDFRYMSWTRLRIWCWWHIWHHLIFLIRISDDTIWIIHQAGIVSFGSSAGCESGMPAAFTRFFYFCIKLIDWNLFKTLKPFKCQQLSKGSFNFVKLIDWTFLCF